MLEEVLSKGFLKEEMQHVAVCVEYKPSAVTESSYVTNPDSSLPMLSESFEAYNKRKSRADELLSACFQEHGLVLYGTLSHTHMALILRAFKCNAKWNMAASEILQFPVCDSSGQLSVSAVAEHPNCVELVDLVHNGVNFEVLSWKMDAEEPDAASLISHALNSA